MAKSVLSSDTLPKAGRVNEGMTNVKQLSFESRSFAIDIIRLTVIVNTY